MGFRTGRGAGAGAVSVEPLRTSQGRWDIAPREGKALGPESEGGQGRQVSISLKTWTFAPSIRAF